MNRQSLYLVKLIIGLAFIVGNPSTATSEDFYEGKTIRIVVGFAPEGGYDTYARAIARHMGKHIPGNPSIVVENMTGAGSLIAANYTYNRMTPDGLNLGIWNSGFVLYQALGSRSVKLDARQLGWIGAPSKETPTCAIMGFTGLEKFGDVLKLRKPLRMGGLRAGSTTDDLPNILNRTLGTKFEVISGYKGTARIRAAMQARELEGACLIWESMRVTARALLHAEGDNKLIPFLTHKRLDDPEVSNIPSIPEVIKANAGEKGLSIYNPWVGQFEFRRPLVAPPEVPKEHLEVLRKAFRATLQDPALIAEAKKSRLPLQYVSAEEIYQQVSQILEISPSAKESLRFLVQKESIPEPSTSLASPPLSPSKPPPPNLAEIVEEELKKLPLGQVLFNPPEEMTVGIKERVEVRIAKTTIENLTERLKGRGMPQIEHIKVNTFMKVRLMGDNFDIRARSHEEQAVENKGFANWDFDVTPMTSGPQILLLSVTVRIKTVYGEDTKDHPVFERKIKVTANPYYSFKVFISTYWQWIIGTIIGSGVIGWSISWMRPRNRSGKSNPENNVDRA